MNNFENKFYFIKIQSVLSKGKAYKVYNTMAKNIAIENKEITRIYYALSIKIMLCAALKVHHVIDEKKLF